MKIAEVGFLKRVKRLGSRKMQEFYYVAQSIFHFSAKTVSRVDVSGKGNPLRKVTTKELPAVRSVSCSQLPKTFCSTKHRTERQMFPHRFNHR